MRNAAKMFSFDPNPTTARKSLVLFYLFTLWAKLSRGEGWAELRKVRQSRAMCGTAHQLARRNSAVFSMAQYL
jgi:hypothetical protein